MSEYYDNVNFYCGPGDIDEPSPVCPTCGVLQDDQYKLAGEYFEWYGDRPFPVFVCLLCGSAEVEWD